MAIRKTLIAIAFLAWGCPPQAYVHDLKPDHPAHPDAAEGMLPGPSSTLAIEDVPSLEGRGGRAHEGESGERMNHDTHRAEGTEASQEQVEGEAGEVLYQCPMHPEITSSDPASRCPKCDMKVNKPVKDGGSAPRHEGHGGDAHEH